MQAIILIGGLGTRLRPLTCNTPKPMLPVLNKPFLLYQIELLKKYDIKDIILCMAYLPAEFKKYFGNGSNFGINISYAIEKTPLGTGGAIKNAERYVKGPVVIFNGDVLTELDLGKLIKYHENKKAKATITLVEVDDPTSYGLVETDEHGAVKRFLEKPSFNQLTCNTINAGTYVFEQEIFKRIPKDKICSVEREIFPKLLTDGVPFYAFTHKEYWIDIGTIEKYIKVHFDLMNKGLSRKGKNTKVGRNVSLNGNLVAGDDSIIKENSEIKGNVCIGNKVKIENNCLLENCIILSGTHVYENSKIKNCIIGKNCIIEDNTTISSGSAVGDNTIIRRFSKL